VNNITAAMLLAYKSQFKTIKCNEKIKQKQKPRRKKYNNNNNNKGKSDSNSNRKQRKTVNKLNRHNYIHTVKC